MEIKQEDQQSSLVHFFSELEAYFLKTEGFFTHS